MITLYSTNCPKCKVLETKLNKKNIEFETCTDMDIMASHKIKAAPALQLENGEILSFADAVRWVNEA